MDALMAQVQVIHALVLRETRTRFGRNRLGYLWALLEPILMIITFAVAYTMFGRQMPGGLPVVSFLVTGFIPYLAFSRTVTQNLHAISGNRGLLFYPGVRPLDLVFARTLLETATHIVVFTLLMAGAVAWEGRLRIDNLLVVTTGLILASMLGAGIGLILCGLSVFSSSVERLVGTLMRPLFWVSALFFATSELPTDVQHVLLFNPVLHVVEITRSGWFVGYDAPGVSMAYPLLWIAVTFYLGLTLERVARRRLQLT